MPPNTNTDYISNSLISQVDYAGSSHYLQQSPARYGGSSTGPGHDQDEPGVDLGGQSFAFSQTIGALTTMA